MDAKEATNLMFNQMRECAKSENTGPKVRDDNSDVLTTIDLMESQVLDSIESSKKE